MSDNIDELKNQLDDIPQEEIEEEPEENKEEETEEENEESVEEEKFSMPDKFKGKTAEEVAKSYTELEGMIDKKAGEKAKEFAKMKEDDEEEEVEEKIEEDSKNLPPMKDGKIDYASMTPEQFANHIDRRIEEKAESKAKEIMTDSRKVRGAVQTEIKDAQKEHPLLKTSSEYRELALAVIEAAAAKGKTITLKDACGKVEGLIGKKKDVEQEDETKMKQAKAQVETGASAGSGKGALTEEDRIKEGMMQQSQTGELGGL